MSCFDKMKSLATRKGVSQKDMSTYFEMSYNSFNNKLRDCETRFNMRDIIKYADTLNLKIAFINEDDKVVEVLDKNDIKK